MANLNIYTQTLSIWDAFIDESIIFIIRILPNYYPSLLSSDNLDVKLLSKITTELFSLGFFSHNFSFAEQLWRVQCTC